MRSLVRSSFVLGLTLVAVPSCKVQVGTSAQPATGSDPVAKPPKKDADGQNKPKRTNPGKAASSSASVWGHFVMANPEKTLGRMSERLAPPMMAPMVSASQVKSMLSMQLEGRGDVAKHLDFTKSFGCVMVNPKQHDQPIACAAGYEGGIPQLVEDLGQEGYQSGGADFAAYEISGDTFYFKAMGDHIGVALDPSLLSAVQPELEASVLRPGKAERDVFVEALPTVIFKDAREEIEGFYREMESAMGPSGQPGSEYAEASAKAAVDMYRTIGELSSAEFVLRIGKQRTKMHYRGTASEGTATAAQYERDAKLPTVDLAMMEALPDDAFFVSGMHFDFAHVMDDPWIGSYMRVLGAMKAPDGTDIGSKFIAMMKSMGETMQGPVTAAGFPIKGSAGAIGVTYAVKPGKDGIALMREVLPSYKMETLMPSFGEFVTSSYKKDAFSVGGVKADTYTVKPSKKTLSEMKKDADFARIKKGLGAVQFTVAYAQKGDRMYMVMTTAKPKKALEKMLRAAAGKGNLGKFGEARKRVKKHAKGTAVMMVDVKGMLAWLRTLDFDDEFANIPKVGTALDDLVWTSRITKRGKKEYEFAISQPFIDQLRSL